MLNQAYLVIEKALPRCRHGIGGRVDFLYSEDYFLAESIGLEKDLEGSPRWNDEYYGLAVPQAYVSSDETTNPFRGPHVGHRLANRVNCFRIVLHGSEILATVD